MIFLSGLARMSAGAMAVCALSATAAIADPIAANDRDDAAAAAFAADERGVLSLIGDNDTLGHQTTDDRWYTSGLMTRYLLPSSATPFLDASGDTAVRVELSLGQDLFTPSDLTISAPIADDRPYAAFLFLGADVVALEPNRELFGVSGLVESRVGLRIGALGGTASLGEFVQETAHSLFSSVDPQGYSNGLESEPAANIVASRDFRVFGDAPLGLEFEARPSATVSLGTVETHVGLGAEFRIGDDLAFDLSRRENRAGVSGGGYFGAPDGFSWSVHVGAQGRAIGRNSYLDGNLFRDGPDPAIDIDSRTFVGEASGGVSLAYERARLSFTYVARTEEFVEQETFQSFGSVALSFRF